MVNIFGGGDQQGAQLGRGELGRVSPGSSSIPILCLCFEVTDSRSKDIALKLYNIVEVISNYRLLKGPKISQ